MADPFDELDALRERPAQKPVMLQSWRDLVFIHWRVEPDLVQSKLPPGLEVDTFEGSAYLSYIPFWMSDIRLPFLPALPGLSSMDEWNFRTYVRRGGQNPGIWFFSLEASMLPAVLAARAAYKLPYHHGRMSRQIVAPELTYTCHRRWPGPATRICRCQAATLDDAAPAVRGSLAYWLVERYLLYSASRNRMFKARVHHEPYPISPATFVNPKLELWRANGFPSLPAPIVDAQYSPGVDVEIFGLERCD